MLSTDIDALLRHREPLLRIAGQTDQAAGPKWSRDLAAYFDELAHDPTSALGRESARPIIATITSLIIAEGITIVTGPAHDRSAEIRSSPGYDAAVAAAADLVQAVSQCDPGLARELYQLMQDLLGAFLDAVQRRDAADPRSQSAG